MAPKPQGSAAPAAAKPAAAKPAAAKPAEKKPAAAAPAGGDKKGAAAGGSKPAEKKGAASKPAEKKPTAGGDKKGAAAAAAGKGGKAAAPKPSTKTAAAGKAGKAGKVTKGKKVAPLPEALKTGTTKEKKKLLPNPLFEKTPKNFSLGGTVQPKRDLGRFVRWPKYIRIQRQRAILKKRLKVPPSVHQFGRTLTKSAALQLFRLLGKYRPETKVEKAARLKALAEQKAEQQKGKKAEKPAAIKPKERREKGKKAEKPARDPTKKPMHIKYGLNHVTALIENKKAQLVVLAHDVDPIELVLWIPALCRKMDVPFCIVKSKSRLGALVHKKNAAVLAVTAVRAEDKQDFSQIVTAVRKNYNDKHDHVRKSWGGGIMGIKSRTRVARLEKSKVREALAKQQQV